MLAGRAANDRASLGNSVTIDENNFEVSIAEKILRRVISGNLGLLWAKKDTKRFGGQRAR